MKITTMLDALISAIQDMRYDFIRDWNDFESNKRRRQYNAFRDGIQRRWIRMEYERALLREECKDRSTEMKINRVVVTIEPGKYPQVDRQTYNMLRIKIERYPGEEVHLEKVIPDDDLLSVWDYIWYSAKKALEEEMTK